MIPPRLSPLWPPRPADAIAPGSVRRALVVMLRHHGDVLLTSPVISALKAAAPYAEIDALVYRETAPMLALHPDLAVLHTIDRAWKSRGPLGRLRAEWDLLSALRGRHHDLLVHLTEHRRGAWLARALAPRVSVAPRRRADRASRFWDASFTHRYPNGSSVGPGSALGRRHVVDQNLDALRRLGIAIAAPPPLTMVAGADGEREADALLAELGVAGPFVAMQPTSRWLFKCWPVERNAALIVRLLARGETILMTCAPDDRERAMVAAIVAAVRAVPGIAHDRLKVADDGSLLRLAATIARAKLFVGIDSAPMHIAAAVGTPTVALFGPSGEHNWGPWQVPHRVVANAAFACRPCGQDGCGGGKVSDCLVTLPVHEVLAAVDDLTRDVDASHDPLRFA